MHFGKGEMQINKAPDEIELPQSIIETFARFLVPEIRKYYGSEQGQKEFAKWQEAQSNQTDKG